MAKWLGHSDNGALLLKTYTHLLDEHGMEMAKRVNNRLPIEKSAQPIVAVEFCKKP